QKPSNKPRAGIVLTAVCSVKESMGGTNGNLDFFISRAGADKSFAKWLARRLVSGEFGRRYRVLLQDWHFLGRNFIAKMDEGVCDARQLIVILSKSYLKSSYTRLEWQAVINANVDDADRRMVILKIDDCQPTGILALYSYTDVTSFLGPSQSEELVRAIG